MKTFRSYSSAETAELGASLAANLLKSGDSVGKSRAARARRRGAIVLALEGDLGAGKTTFTQGFARGLGIKRRTASPTFIIMRRFALPAGEFKNFYHVDAYRIRQTDSLEPIGFEEAMADPRNIVLIEWPEKIRKIIPKDAVHIQFDYGKKENERIIKGVSLSL